ncbi:MAG: FliM/FliN family flagellar motor switch protein [Treponema sp.]|nr:FliM/FliN family flagellar motor switch protein [Treponema sp.]
MDAQRTGKLINYLRSKKGITQKDLAELINVSDKAVSKWERGDGCPDVGILPSLAQALGTDVDSLLKGELKEVSEERRILTEEELKAEIAKMEAAGTLEKPKNDTSLLKNPGVRIFLYDFKRPDLFSKYELRTIANTFEMLCDKLRTELGGNRNDLLGIKLLSVDQLTNEEFIRTVPQRTFFYTYDYNNSGFAIEIDPQIGKVLLKHDLKKYPELTQTDSECLKLAYADKFAQMIQEMIFSYTDKSISWEDFEKHFTKGLNTLMPWYSGQNPGEMCTLVTLELISDVCSGMINIQFNYSYFLRLCRKAGFFGKDNPQLENLTDIKARPRENNVLVEFGRFVSDSVKLEPGTLLMSNKKYGTPLNVIIDNEIRFGGEAVVAEENFGVRIVEVKQVEPVRYDEEHYIALRLGGTYLSADDIARLDVSFILQLDSQPGRPIAIIQDGKCVARGEVVIIDDTFAVRIVD